MEMTCLSSVTVCFVSRYPAPAYRRAQGQFLDCCYSAAPAKPAVAVGDQW